MSWRSRARRLAAVVATVAAAGTIGVAQEAPAGHAAVLPSELPGECPPVMATADLVRGMTGTGLSVTQGRDPSAFDVEVLDVLRDAVGPGRDIIVVNLSGPVIDAAGGLWFGASGSPVYLPDEEGGYRLVGAVAYGLAGGPSTLAGLTPAEDMLELLDTEEAGDPLSALGSVRLPRATVARIAARLGESDVGNTLVRLKTPMSVSGVNSRGMQRVRAAIGREGLSLLPYMGSSAAVGPSAEPAELSAGDSFAAALSLGDVTLAGVGTTTFVCYEQAIAFGHPFNWSGETTMAARAADTITIVEDSIFGSYKLANIAENAGVVTSDRLAGIAAHLGEGPATVPVTTFVRDLDSGRERAGASEAVMPDVLPFLAFLHAFQNVDVTIDRIGPGNAEVHYAITGTLASGAPWTLERASHFASQSDISIESVAELGRNLDVLHAFREEEGVEITGVDVGTLEVEKTFEVNRLTDVRVWNGRAFVRKAFVRARPGQTILLQATLTPKPAAAVEKVVLSLTVPLTAKRSGYIEVRGGSTVTPAIPCLFEDGECGEESDAASFGAVLAELRRQPRGDDVVARLRLGPLERIRASATETSDAVVRGARIIGFELIGARCCFEFRRASGR